MKIVAVDFYDVAKREKVSVEESDVKKKEYRRTTKSGKEQVRYALRGTLSDGRKVTKFVSKDTFDSMSVPVEN